MWEKVVMVASLASFVGTGSTFCPFLATLR